MHVVVLGAGVIGVTTAYYLSQLGCEVTVVDRASKVGDGASFANAGQLSYSFTDALAKPEFLAQIPALMLGRDNGIQVRLSSELVAWGTRFVGQCTRRHARENTLAVLKIAMRSASLLAEMRKAMPFDFWHRKAGKLVLLSNQTELNGAKATVELKQSHGCETCVLSRSEAVSKEPSLEHISEDIVGAVYSESDEVADSQTFTAGLRDWLEQSGQVEFRLASTVRDIV